MLTTKASLKPTLQAVASINDPSLREHALQKLLGIDAEALTGPGAADGQLKAGFVLSAESMAAMRTAGRQGVAGRGGARGRGRGRARGGAASTPTRGGGVYIGKDEQDSFKELAEVIRQTLDAEPAGRAQQIEWDM